MNSPQKLPSSFRDPAGFVYEDSANIFRQINPKGMADYNRLMSSGLYAALVKKGLLIPHAEVSKTAEKIIIKPETIPFISYPYEWCFEQYKDAALAVLDIQDMALKQGQTLKDATAYNMQFMGGKPVLIDTLSFTTLPEGKPWIAYRQFCQHFLAPLALMAKKDIRLSHLMVSHMDGVPLDLASKLLPAATYLNMGLLMHVHMHAAAQNKFENEEAPVMTGQKISLFQQHAMVDSLRSAIKACVWKGQNTEWGNYYTFTNYSDKAFHHKVELVTQHLEKIQPRSVADLGANDGTFSRLATARKINTLAFDIDPVAVNRNYCTAKKSGEAYMLPLLQNLSSPSPAIGWHNHERNSFMQRVRPDCVLALALIHHIAISNNVPLPELAAFFAELTPNLIIEFVPKDDSKVQKLLSTREDIFPDYNQAGFEAAFAKHFKIIEKTPVRDSLRTLYMMKRAA